jgi:DHA1 family bicyclomycin/chloramphenicol resistance-like MFS transporter
MTEYLCVVRNNTNNKFKIILILGLLTAIALHSIDIYRPAFPAIARNLYTTVSDLTLSLSNFLIGISTRQLLYDLCLNSTAERILYTPDFGFAV